MKRRAYIAGVCVCIMCTLQGCQIKEAALDALRDYAETTESVEESEKIEDSEVELLQPTDETITEMDRVLSVGDSLSSWNAKDVASTKDTEPTEPFTDGNQNVTGEIFVEDGLRKIIVNEMTVIVPEGWISKNGFDESGSVILTPSDYSMLSGDYIFLRSSDEKADVRLREIKTKELAQLLMETSLGKGTVVNDYQLIENTAFEDLCYFDITDSKGNDSEVYLGMNNGYLYLLSRGSVSQREEQQCLTELRTMVDSASFDSNVL